MARTHAHRSYTTRLIGSSAPLEHHDHRHGECDLVPFAQWRQLLRREPLHRLNRTRRCVWELSVAEQQGMCGCELCTRQFDRRQHRRRERQAGRRQARSGTD
jgi:hypothetical protein